MNDREMLETVYAAMDRCPLCHLYGHEHEDGCPLHRHLHPEVVEGSWQWAEEQGKAGKKVRRKAWRIVQYVYVKDGVWFLDAGLPCCTTKPGYQGDGDGDDWELYPKPEHVAEAIGLKFLRDGKSAWAKYWGYSTVDYPVGKWIEVPGDGCYLATEAGRADSPRDSIFSGNPSQRWPDTSLQAAYFEASEEIDRLGHSVARYRYVRRLEKPCPERLSKEFWEWLNRWREMFTPKQQRDLGIVDEPKSRPETVRWPIEADHEGLIVIAPLPGEPKPCRLCLSSWELVCGAIIGAYRLSHFVGHTADGREVEMGGLTKVWADVRDKCYRADSPGVSWRSWGIYTEPVWADTAIMEKEPSHAT